MRVRLQNDDSGQTFSDQLLAMGNGKLPVDSISGRIQLPAEFRNLVMSKKEMIEKCHDLTFPSTIPFSNQKSTDLLNTIYYLILLSNFIDPTLKTDFCFDFRYVFGSK